MDQLPLMPEPFITTPLSSAIFPLTLEILSTSTFTAEVLRPLPTSLMPPSSLIDYGSERTVAGLPEKTQEEISLRGVQEETETPYQYEFRWAWQSQEIEGITISRRYW